MPPSTLTCVRSAPFLAGPLRWQRCRPSHREVTLSEVELVALVTHHGFSSAKRGCAPASKTLGDRDPHVLRRADLSSPDPALH